MIETQGLTAQDLRQLEAAFPPHSAIRIEPGYTDEGRMYASACCRLCGGEALGFIDRLRGGDGWLLGRVAEDGSDASKVYASLAGVRAALYGET